MQNQKSKFIKKLFLKAYKFDTFIKGEYEL